MVEIAIYSMLVLIIKSKNFGFSSIEPTGRRTRRALEKGEKYCPLSKIEVKKKVVKTQNKKI